MKGLPSLSKKPSDVLTPLSRHLHHGVTIIHLRIECRDTHDTEALRLEEVLAGRVNHGNWLSLADSEIRGQESLGDLIVAAARALLESCEGSTQLDWHLISLVA